MLVRWAAAGQFNEIINVQLEHPLQIRTPAHPQIPKFYK